MFQYEADGALTGGEVLPRQVGPLEAEQVDFLCLQLSRRVGVVGGVQTDVLELV